MAALGVEVELRRLRRRGLSSRLGHLFALEHSFAAAALLSGAWLARVLGWSLGHARWFGVKLGLVAFLLVPLEGMHAYACHVLILAGEGRARERGFSVEEMVRTLEVVVLLPALALMAWLSFAQPF